MEYEQLGLDYAIKRLKKFLLENLSPTVKGKHVWLTAGDITISVNVEVWCGSIVLKSNFLNSVSYRDRLIIMSMLDEKYQIRGIAEMKELLRSYIVNFILATEREARILRTQL